jgi:putative ABC transport system permease protein
MNLLMLVLKQMRQRTLSTTLTILSVTLGVALAVAIYTVDSEGQSAFAQTDYGYELIVGPKASPTQLVLNTVYHLDKSPGNIPYALYEDLSSNKPDSAFGEGKKNPFRGMVQWAVPYAVGDSYMGHRIVATTPALFGVDDDGKSLPPKKVPEYRMGKHYEFAEGRAFAPAKFEAVIGSETARQTGLKIGSPLQATHGVIPVPGKEDVHPEVWTVVGILAPTHTANDRVLFIPLPTFYAIFEHEAGEEAIQKIKNQATGIKPPTAPAAPAPASSEAAPDDKAYTMLADGTVIPKLPKAEWEISAVLVRSKGTALLQIRKILEVRPEAIAVNPAKVMSDFFGNFLDNIVQVLLVISVLVVIVAGVSILVSIYNAVSARTREIAILRALGATRMRILAVICTEAGLGGLAGSLLGLILGHALAAIGSVYLARQMGQGIPWWTLHWYELDGVIAVTAMAVVAGLVPALKAYSVSVAENLSA